MIAAGLFPIKISFSARLAAEVGVIGHEGKHCQSNQLWRHVDGVLDETKMSTMHYVLKPQCNY